MNNIIARCIYEELRQLFPTCHIQEKLDDPLGPRLLLGIDCEMPAPGQSIQFFLPLVDIVFQHGQINLAQIRSMDRPVGIEYCNPQMMDLLQEEIAASLRDALEQMTRSWEQKVNSRSVI